MDRDANPLIMMRQSRSVCVWASVVVLIILLGMFLDAPNRSVKAEAADSQVTRTFDADPPGGLPKNFIVGTLVDGRPAGEWTIIGMNAPQSFLQAETRESQPPSVDLPKDHGTLEGFVRLGGNALPQPTRIENTTDPKVCGRLQTLEDLLASPKTHGIQNVIVALKDVPASNSPVNHESRLILDNRKCKFVPHVSVLTVGDTIETKNSDPTRHNVHFYGILNANIALPLKYLPLKGVKATRKVNKPGMVLVKCDIHGWMQAFIRVDHHPFHAVTDNNGYFRIPDIPAGTYHVEIWHERLGPLQKTIHITSMKTERIEVEYSLNDH